MGWVGLDFENSMQNCKYNVVITIQDRNCPPRQFLTVIVAGWVGGVGGLKKFDLTIVKVRGWHLLRNSNESDIGRP